MLEGKKIRSIVVIGTGRLATSLGKALFDAGCSIVQVYGRDPVKAGRLAGLLQAEPVSRPASITREAGLYLLSLSDSAYLPFLKVAGLENVLLVHTSGSIETGIFSPYTDRFGCIYPLQTFSFDRQVDFSRVPVFVDASDPGTEQQLAELCSILGSTVKKADSELRAYIHLAAVIACNFINRMLSLSGRIMEKNGLEFALLYPLVLETAEKAFQQGPVLAQTGPAARADHNILEKHIDLLSGEPEIRDIYKIISQNILREYHKQA